MSGKFIHFSPDPVRGQAILNLARHEGVRGGLERRLPDG